MNDEVFTKRELDVVAALLTQRSDKKIAALLSVSPRTVSTHIRNICNKLQCGSRDGIIDFVTNRGMLQEMYDRYSEIVLESAFSKKLLELSKSKPNKRIVVSLSERTPNDSHGFIQHSLQMASIEICPPHENMWTHQLDLESHCAWKIMQRNRPPIELRFPTDESDIIKIATVLSILLEDEALIPFLESIQQQHSINTQRPGSVKRKILSGLQIPAERFLLQRGETLEEMKQILDDQEGIRSIALLGPGGAGKTVLARQFAAALESDVIWEVNAESLVSLQHGLERLAEELVVTPTDLAELEYIRKVQKDSELIRFIRSRLAQSENWILLFDNAENFVDINPFIPNTANLWGQGTILITTRDESIKFNQSISYVLPLAEISPQQKLDLFSSISQSSFENQLIIDFLDQVPSYPLDVVCVAAFLTATSMRLSDYVDLINEQPEQFEKIQSEFLKEVGGNLKTRYNIVTASLDRVLSEDPNLAKYLLMISLLDSQDIPLNLLKELGSISQSARLIRALKKYSLITSDSTDPNPVFSIHRATHKIMYSYLTQTLELQNKGNLVGDIFEAMDNYISQIIEKEDLHSMGVLLGHYKEFLSHSTLLPMESRGILHSKLGRIYYNQGYYEKAKTSHTIAMALLPEGTPLDAWNLTLLGQACRSLGELSEAQEFLEKAQVLYQQFTPEQGPQALRNKLYLAVTLRDMGHCLKARLLAEDCIQDIHPLGLENTLLHGQVLMYLGQIQSFMGDFETCLANCEEALTIFQTKIPPNPLREAWALTCIGYTQLQRGQYANAIDALQKSSSLTKGTLHALSDDGMLTIASMIGAYIAQKHIENAKDLLITFFQSYPHYVLKSNISWSINNIIIKEFEEIEDLAQEAVQSYKHKYGNQHIAVARGLWYLAQIQLLIGKSLEAEDVLKDAIKIYGVNNHSEAHLCLKVIFDIVKQRATDLNEPLPALAIEYLKQAIDLVETSYGSDSGYFKEYQKVLNELRY